MTEFEIFDAARKIKTPTKRAIFLDHLCAGKPDLRDAVDELLRFHEQGQSPFDGAATEQMGAALGHSLSESIQPADAILARLRPSTEPGQLAFLDHYAIQCPLGHGGFGTVFRAVDQTLQRTVALKIMSPELALTSPARKRFLREARSAAAIRNEHVVSIHSVGDAPLPYIVMEYVPGQTLQDRLNENGPLEVEEILQIGYQLASGLAAAHAIGIVHRDLKPSNILLETGDQIRTRITDFGLARAVDDASVTRSGMIAGTPLYMAPEQAAGKFVDQRADLFSLGSVLYVMLSGRPPFRAPSTLAVMKRVAEDQPRPIREIIPDAPEWLCRLIDRLHQKSPDARIQTAAEVATILKDSLQALKDGRQMPALPATQISKLPPAKPETVSESAPHQNHSGHSSKEMMIPGLVIAVMAITAAALWFSKSSDSMNSTLEKSNNHRVTPGAISQNGADSSSLRNAVPEPATGKASPAANPANATAETGESTKSPRAGWHGWPTDAPNAAIAPFPAVAASKYQEAWARYLNIPVEWTNSVGMTFVLIPPGEYDSGTTEEELSELRKRFAGNTELQKDLEFELPRRRIVITQPFYLSMYEVTQQQYRIVTGRQPSFFVIDQGWAEKVVGAELADFPVDAVTWNDADRFCRQLSLRERHFATTDNNRNATTEATATFSYRLPTEAEWEFAARAGATTLYISGDQSDGMLTFASCMPGSKYLPSPVGSTAPNPFGCYDIIGNTAEWVDNQINDLAGDAPLIDPRNRDKDAQRHVGRGGSWSVSEVRCRYGLRILSTRGSDKHPDWGFRVAIPIESTGTLLKGSIESASLPGISDRRAAEWVLSVGGRATLKLEDGSLRDFNTGPLPDGDLRIKSVFLRDHPNFTNAGMQNFRFCDELRYVDFSHFGQLNDEGFAALEACAVEVLTLNNCPGLSAGACRTIAQWDSLKAFHLQDSLNSDDLLKEFPKASRLRQLTVHGPGFSDVEVEALGKAFTEVQQLYIVNAPDVSGLCVRQFPKLQSVYLRANQLTPEVVAELNRIASFARLQLMIDESDQWKQPLGDLERISTLILCNADGPTSPSDLIPDYSTVKWPPTMSALYFLGSAVSPSDSALTDHFAKLKLALLALNCRQLPDRPPRYTQAGLEAFRTASPQTNVTDHDSPVGN